MLKLTKMIVITILYMFLPPPPPIYNLISTVTALGGWGIAQGHNNNSQYIIIMNMRLIQYMKCSRTSLTHPLQVRDNN